jgi:2-dehydro-3-deoxyphosphogluconate aldolase/(4S)-4-hydroxy-2-oxoglutarate aldolase
MNVLEVMSVGQVIAVIVIEELAQAVPLAKALVAGGVRVLEMTLCTCLSRARADESMAF